MTKTMFEMVRDFHVAFEQRVGEKPELPDENERSLRIKLLSEEMGEYLFVLQSFCNLNADYANSSPSLKLGSVPIIVRATSYAIFPMTNQKPWIIFGVRIFQIINH